MAFGYGYGYGYRSINSIISVVAWIALNGELATLADGTRKLVNSKGANVTSTTGQMLTANGVDEGLTIARDISNIKTFIVDMKYDEADAGNPFANDGKYGDSFDWRIEYETFRIYYLDSNGDSSSTWHDTAVNWDSKKRVGVVIDSESVKVYIDGILTSTFPPMKNKVYSDGLFYLFCDDGFDNFTNASMSNFQMWETVFDAERMMYDYTNPEESYQLAFAEADANQHIEEFTIPTYDSEDATHLLITDSNGEWTQANFNADTPYRHFYMEAGDYGNTRMHFYMVGTQRDEYTVSLHNWNDIHPASLADADQAVCFFQLDGNYITVDRLSFLGKVLGLEDYYTYPALRVVSGGSNNLVNRWHCRDFGYGYQIYNRSSMGMCHYNTLQKSYIHDQTDVMNAIVKDGYATVISTYGTEDTTTIGNKIISNDMCNTGDGFQSAKLSSSDDDSVNGEGTIVYNNRMWFTGSAYRDSDGTQNDDGDFMEAEEAIDLKFGSENPANPMIIEKNIAFGYKAILKNNDSNTATSPAAFFSHYGVHNTHMNYNISAENGAISSLNSFVNGQYIGNIAVDTNIVNPNDQAVNCLYLSDAQNTEINNNVFVRHHTNVAGDSSVIADNSLSANNTLDNNVLISCTKAYINYGTDNSASNTWLYNHTGDTMEGTEHVYPDIADIHMSDFSFAYERYTTTPKVKTLEGILTVEASLHFGLAGYIPTEESNIGAVVMLPLIDGTGTPKEYKNLSTVDVSTFSDIENSWDIERDSNRGLQKIGVPYNTMSFNANQSSQIVTTVPTEAYSIKVTLPDDTVYIYTDDRDENRHLHIDSVEQSTPDEITGNLTLNYVSQLTGGNIDERTEYKVYDGILTP